MHHSEEDDSLWGRHAGVHARLFGGTAAVPGQPFLTNEKENKVCVCLRTVAERLWKTGGRGDLTCRSVS